ncbi:uncharacterized protein CANTADRAFT_20554 [Suhomyces tanzawaensis NRRL Y-17324]|uniref:Uncharacterized protein n=1 Tax=Suhomyces tanzawaensis NRRL Y-17324 TaxID=984487 RepID=A0A1E4SNA1_9ASCO|nr:uncharacterized protein CANTADRAFT_20554 [Suhomyces tanzawaensis NRRL Y-17324]ODV81004.1 hypothetical protein CANTADRAFT_20554 [Suhomyces tanzawaensis NRRL Y-17324]
MLARARTSVARSITQSGRRFNSSSSHDSHHKVTESKPIEINLAKVFGIAAAAGALLVYKNHEKTDKPLVSTPLYNEQSSGERENARNENYLKRYKTSFIKELIRDKGGIGQKQYRRITDTSAIPNVLIPSHSPYGNQFGSGIKTDQLGPRKERIRIYAPIDTASSA